jgi:1,4-alpha-glucan branching enzyme
MVEMAKKNRVISGGDKQLSLDNTAKTLVYKKGTAFFAFNFHPVNSYDGFFVPTGEEGQFKVILATDNYNFGGHGRIANAEIYTAEKQSDGRIGFKIYLPSRTAIVLKKKPNRRKK